MSDIVAARIHRPKDIITNDIKTIISAVELELPVEFLTRERMQFMAALDLGSQWEKLATAPTIFEGEIEYHGCIGKLISAKLKAGDTE